VSTVFLGDGTLGQGVTYESLNIASLWRLPVLFVVENNHYAQSTPIGLELAGSIPARAAAYGIETAELDTTDVEEIHDAAGRAVGRIRETGEPYFLVLHTYRFSPHSKGDDNRDPAEIEERRKRDPLGVSGPRLADDERRAIEEACERRVAEVVEAAEAAPSAASEAA
jgi:TPP-dependent pyruvate/acetoin dehydrogenase alpha subunit